MRYILTTFLLLLFLDAHADNPFNSESFWGKLVYEEQPVINDFSRSDTAIVVVTNRARTTSKLWFMSEYKGYGTLKYFFVYAYNGKWHVLEKESLEAVTELTPDKNRDWVVYTEGMGKIFTSELDRGMNMAAQYKVNVIMLDYPSITTTRKMSGNYLFAIRNARHAYKDLLPAIEKIKELKQNNKLGTRHLSLFFHSMGNYVMRQIVKKGDLPTINKTQWVDNIILNAACVPQSRHTLWLNKIKFAKRIYVHYNPDDRVLSGAHLISKRKQLGEKIKSNKGSKAIYINFSKLVGDKHSYFLSLAGRDPVKQRAKEHYAVVLHGNAIKPKENNFYRPSDYKSIGWDIQPE